MAEAEVRALYQDVHDRSPASGELADWVDQRLLGLSMDRMRAAFLQSEEHLARLRNDRIRAAIAGSGLLDGAWYLRKYRDVAAAGLDGLKHYIEHGWREDRAPNAYFDAAWYRAASGIARDDNPLLHYIRHGEANGVWPGPNFDPVWYRTAYELAEAVSPLADFLMRRLDRLVAPCARLWSVLWRPRPEPAEADPFQQFLRTSPNPATADNQLLQASGLFDSNFYALHSADVMEAQMDPLDHFCEFGWREGRQPNFYFNQAWYLATNPDARRLAVNPVLHYLLVGEPAGRRPIVFFDPAWYRDTYSIPAGASPLAHYLANRRSQKFSPNALFDPAWYMAHSKSAVNPRRDPFSHFLIAGMQCDVAPSKAFDPAAWRRRSRGRPTRAFKTLLSPERDNPLIDYLLAMYR